MTRLATFLASLCLLFAGTLLLGLFDSGPVWTVLGVLSCLGSAALAGAYLGQIAASKAITRT